MLNRSAIAVRAPTATARAGAARHAHRRRQPSRILSPRRSHSRIPFSPTAIDRVRRCDRFATPSNLALSIAPRDFYNTPRKPRDGSGTVPPAALRTPPLRRRSANPLTYQWLSLPVAWTTRKHIDDAGGRDYLTPDAPLVQRARYSNLPLNRSFRRFFNALHGSIDFGARARAA